VIDLPRRVEAKAIKFKAAKSRLWRQLEIEALPIFKAMTAGTESRRSCLAFVGEKYTINLLHSST
jgi:hypothetical protein